MPVKGEGNNKGGDFKFASKIFIRDIRTQFSAAPHKNIGRGLLYGYSNK